jgi:hypothetical protein
MLGTPSAQLSAASEAAFIRPPKAKPVAGTIREVLLSPIYRQDFMCSEHFNGQLDYAGDALGSDCMIVGGTDDDRGFSRLFRAEGQRNEDWYGWLAPVLSPVRGTVVGTFEKGETNVPGAMGKPPAGMIQIRTGDGIIVLLAHVVNISVKLGGTVLPGQAIAQVGNNGFARAPHIHVGAYVQATAEPLQIRWDLDAMRKLRAQH